MGVKCAFPEVERQEGRGPRAEDSGQPARYMALCPIPTLSRGWHSSLVGQGKSWPAEGTQEKDAGAGIESFMKTQAAPPASPRILKDGHSLSPAARQTPWHSDSHSLWWCWVPRTGVCVALGPVCEGLAMAWPPHHVPSCSEAEKASPRPKRERVRKTDEQAWRCHVQSEPHTCHDQGSTRHHVAL